MPNKEIIYLNKILYVLNSVNHTRIVYYSNCFTFSTFFTSDHRIGNTNNFHTIFLPQYSAPLKTEMKNL